MAPTLRSVCQWFGVILLLNIYAEGSKILVVSNIPSVSHSIWYIKLVKLLVNQGHEIVFLDVEPNNFQHENVTHYHLTGAHDNFRAFMAAMESGAIPMESVVKDYSVIGNIEFITNPDVLGCRRMLLSDEFTKFLKDYKGFHFDLIIFDIGCEAFYGLVSYFGNVPFIVATGYAEPFNILELALSVYDNPSYVPSPFTLHLPEMSFQQRITNSFYKLYYYYKILFNLLPNQQALAEEVFGKSVGDLHEVVSNVALIMYTNHFALFGAKPLPPTVIPIAGFHIDPPKPLPKDIKTFLDDAKNGAIYFSMGSNIKSAIMSKENINMFLDVFREMPQRVIWKLEIDDKTNIPPNVMISKWLPQSDILGHPNVRCFISHGGLNGVQEGVHHGVPILGMPILFDQVQTIDRLEKEGVGLHLSYPKLNRAYFKKKLTQILTDQSITFKMKEKSRIFRDSPETPRERTLFWIEFVLRNSQSSLNFMKTASSKLTWYQRTLLDVAAVFLCAIIVVVYILLKIVNLIMRLTCPSKRKVKHD